MNIIVFKIFDIWDSETGAVSNGNSSAASLAYLDALKNIYCVCFTFRRMEIFFTFE